ncbi:DUF805 domain-containing protein [Streptomyces alboflavus]|uniref:DUF805 domain-containing protein n=1 Tax=Streptomyces alboflavus TaxID=67267 RepID=UPI0004C21DF5|nr:DUF805 domain-containing protein [Streptomyces alboflavus]
MHWYVDVLKKYAVFNGRARRAEYWMFTLISLIVSLVIFGIDMALGIWVLEAVYSLAVLIPGIAVSVRRLHDTDRSGWWLLLFLIPLIGMIILIVWLAQDSKPANRYGPSPKAATAAPAW